MAVKQTRLKDFGKRSGLKVYPVSIGAMRLPEDDDQAVALMRQAIDAGMIYIDTSRGYGDSEIKVGKSLKGGYREKVILSTKSSPWLVKIDDGQTDTAEGTYRRIIGSLERLDVDYVNFYQMWNISREEHFNQATRKGGMLDGIIRAMDEGLVKHTGFTTHDWPEHVSKYIDQAEWCETILFSYNILNPQNKDIIAKAHEKGIATVVMNPAVGGMFSKDSGLLKDAVKKATGLDNPIEAAHRYLAGDENVDTILCGIEKPSDIVSTIENYNKPPFTAQQRKAIEKSMRKLTKEGSGFCTGCQYCLPCPAGINIPEMMDIIFYEKVLKMPELAKNAYKFQTFERNMNPSALPQECTQCGKCELKCTQHLNIIEKLKYIANNKLFREE